MRNERLLLPLLPLSLLLGAFGLVSAACGSSSSGGTAGDCFDYSTFTGTTPAVTFSTDVLPIFRRSCALSIACHGSDPMSPGSTMSGYLPYLGTATTDSAPTAAQLTAIRSSTVGQAATLQTSSIDPSMMVGNPDMKIITAGDPKNSFMMYKLDGSFPTPPDGTEVSCATLTCAAGETCGGAMPSAGPSLAAADILTIRRWIAQGATTD
jgi:hypothetical protein